MLGKTVVACSLVLLVSASAVYAVPRVEYILSIPQPQTHLFSIEMDIRALEESELDLSMPVWSTGYYLVLDFAGRVVQFEALGHAGEKLKWRKIDKNTWRIQTDGSPSVKAKYVVYGRAPSNLFSFVNSRTGHILGCNLFMFMDGREELPATLRLNIPEEWRLSSGAIPVEGDATLFEFESYHQLIDTPMIIGKHSEYTYEVDGIPHVVAIEGETDMDHEQFVESTKKLVEAASNLFGGLPYDKYCFIVYLSEQIRGGLEHANGTTMGRPPWEFSNDPKRMESLLDLTAHEYFHTWNVKRIQPHVFKPYDYDSETTTGFLWFSEGVTDYYTVLLLLQAGLYDRKLALEHFAGLITETRNTPGRFYKSAFDSSFDTWLNPWDDENAENARISYYPKGKIAGLIIDLEILRRTGAEKSFDDVLLAMWNAYRQRDAGFDTEEVLRLCEHIAGGSFEQVFADYVYGVREVPFEDYLKIVGYQLVTDTDKTKKEQEGAYLGARYAEEQGKVVVTHVTRDTEAWVDGLDIGDEIIAFRGLRIHSPKALDLQLELCQPGDDVPILVGREERVVELRVTMQNYPVPIYKIVSVDNPTNVQLEIRKKWLRIEE